MNILIKWKSIWDDWNVVRWNWEVLKSIVTKYMDGPYI